MDFKLDEVEIRHKDATSRFEAEVGAHKAFITYRRENGRLVLDHTRVPPELEGHGLAGKLTRTALDYARAEGFKVVAECPYVKAWLERHPDYQDLAAES
jgi:uncharacterized protein